MNLTREDLYWLLKLHFDIDDLPLEQIEVINHVLSGKDTLVIKGHVADYHICYMLPTIVIDGISILVSRDANLNSEKLPVPSVYLKRSMTNDHFQRYLAEIINGKYKLIQVEPELFQNRNFLLALSKISVSLFVIDEAQCLSKLRHDFNYAYLNISRAILDIDPTPTILTFANTYRDDIQKSIIAQLQMEATEIINIGHNFPDLSLEVIKLKSNKDKLAYIRQLAENMSGQGIIFANQRNFVNEIKSNMEEIIPEIEEYYGSLEIDRKFKIERDFQSKKLKAIVSTNRYYSEIPKCNIDYIIHADLPEGIETYYDQISKFIKQDQLLRCFLLYSPSDREYHQIIIEKGNVSSVDIWRLSDTLKKYTKEPKQNNELSKKKISTREWLDNHYNNLMPRAKKELDRLKDIYDNLNDQDKNPCSLDEYNKYLDSDHWRNFAKSILENNKSCYVCNAKSEHIHHLHYRNFRKENPDDVVALCPKCHCYIHPDNPMTSNISAENIDQEYQQYRLFRESKPDLGHRLFIEANQLELDSGLNRSGLHFALSEMQNAGMLDILPDCSLTAKVSIIASRGELISYINDDTSKLLIEWLMTNLEANEQKDINIRNISYEISCYMDDIENVLLDLSYNKAISYKPQRKVMVLNIYDLDIGHEESTFEKIKGERYGSLRALIEYINTKECRKKFMNQYIIGSIIEKCGKCDNCGSVLSESTENHKKADNKTQKEAYISESEQISIIILNCAEKIDGMLSRR
ncbi:TPA: RecQ family ATP-dependent DNA helicase, partial [bacterium]|nr:RecQ family ATP-dependent DNA helicase [bacterium]